uniref:Uncharacterized protein n=1 Tax=Setaria viridis TaxID=4556 RepID=A0A4U6VRA9_SETVI|nr:hypothetical protein SEVIR_2G161518v2 [Setaria viridis]
MRATSTILNACVSMDVAVCWPVVRESRRRHGSSVASVMLFCFLLSLPNLQV